MNITKTMLPILSTRAQSSPCQHLQPEYTTGKRGNITRQHWITAAVILKRQQQQGRRGDEAFDKGYCSGWRTGNVIIKMKAFFPLLPFSFLLLILPSISQQPRRCSPPASHRPESCRPAPSRTPTWWAAQTCKVNCHQIPPAPLPVLLPPPSLPSSSSSSPPWLTQTSTHTIISAAWVVIWVLLPFHLRIFTRNHFEVWLLSPRGSNTRGAAP